VKCLNYPYILKRKGRAGGKKWSFLGVGTCGKRIDTGKVGMRVYMVDVICNHIMKIEE
jgi:hypothetical protein